MGVLCSWNLKLILIPSTGFTCNKINIEIYYNYRHSLDGGE
jgi:hypothetical protein